MSAIITEGFFTPSVDGEFFGKLPACYTVLVDINGSLFLFECDDHATPKKCSPFLFDDHNGGELVPLNVQNLRNAFRKDIEAGRDFKPSEEFYRDQIKRGGYNRANDIYEYFERELLALDKAVTRPRTKTRRKALN